MRAYLSFTQRESDPWVIDATKQVMIAVIENPVTDATSEFYITVELDVGGGTLQWKKIKGWDLTKDRPNVFIMPPGRFRIEAKFAAGESDVTKNQLEWFISPTDG